ncbi:MAG TPA: hypothetical protein VLE69_00310 [Candidatus Saccharimonadales bacterium]|nr:hypothetical protein [Candidatus Saccharimonadales bacterium]
MRMFQEYREDIRFTLDSNPQASFLTKGKLVVESVFFTHGGRVDDARAFNTPLASVVELPWDDASLDSEEVTRILAQHVPGTLVQGEVDEYRRFVDEP